jgi:hypothetical protein
MNLTYKRYFLSIGIKTLFDLTKSFGSFKIRWVKTSFKTSTSRETIFEIYKGKEEKLSKSKKLKVNKLYISAY